MSYGCTTYWQTADTRSCHVFYNPRRQYSPNTIILKASTSRVVEASFSYCHCLKSLLAFLKGPPNNKNLLAQIKNLNKYFKVANTYCNLNS